MRHCTLGVGCEESGLCYALAMDYPEQCGMAGESAEIEHLRAALEPFATLADDFLSEQDRDGSTIELFVNVGDLRRAQAARNSANCAVHKNALTPESGETT